MVGDPKTPPLNLLERLDLALASRLASSDVDLQELMEGSSPPPWFLVNPNEWVAGVLCLRGLRVNPVDVESVSRGERSRFGTGDHEYRLIAGMTRVYNRIVSRAQEFGVPDGSTLVDLFEEFTLGIARFRNNCVRSDMPWDAILYVDYPKGERVEAELRGFRRDNCYADHPHRFENLHPVRQAFRVLWKFARIAPFPDFNLTMSWVAMNLFLLGSGYPMIIPDPD